MAMKKAYWLLLLAPWFCRADEPLSSGLSKSADSTGFGKSVQPFFAKNCYSCHNAKLKTSGLNLEAYVSASSATQDREEFEKILRRLQTSEMPPKGMTRPNDAELKAVTRWIQGEFDLADRMARPKTPRVLVRRLNRAEYNNTVRDLLGVDTQPANDFPPDDSAYGFDNIAQALSISPPLMEKYLATAERVAREAVFGPPWKTETAIFVPPVPRRMEFTNRLRVQPPAYYSMTDYDETGLSHPGSFHLRHRFPTDGEYLIRVVGAGFRPNGSDPGKMTIWLDGELAQTFTVDVNVEQSGFERRPDHSDVRMRIPAGFHELIVAYPKQYEGLPPIFHGPNPSKTDYDPCKILGNGAGRCLANLDLPEETDPERAEKRRQQIERIKEDETRPRFEGMAVAEVNIIGPTDYKAGPSPESVRKIYTCGRVNGLYAAGCERQILSNLACRAYRRPVSRQETDALVAIAAGARKRGGSFEEGLSLAIATILASPNFLFRIDKERPAPEAARSTSQYELASRLSYFLWSSMPDQELLRAAERGTLRRPEVLDAQVRRMLADPKAQALVENFPGQWLETRRLEAVQPDRERYPDFDDYLRTSMKKETELFFQYVIQADRSILDFIDGPYTFLNERLARHYGIRGVTGTEFRKVDLTGTGRGGILTQASALTVSSYGNRTSPVLRGKWMLENILNAPPPPPPPNVPSLNEDAVGSLASLRQQMEEHRKNPVCASCHSRMDPLGFGLENYDAVGAWRTMDGKFQIDSSGVLPNGSTFHGAAELKTILKEQGNAFAEGLTEKMLIYALGRGIERYERPDVKQIVIGLAANDYTFSSLVLGIVNSAPFQMERK
jgi:hypothetical protein